ncbi:Vacuolar protein sorting-associated protein 11 [Venturia nashicola]|nr:Vacuolar protein sorting-associated protein 11 [Venturia nashicola]
MTSSKEVERLLPELSSSPPRPAESEPAYSEYWTGSSAATSPTLTLGHSSPELPTLPPLPALPSSFSHIPAVPPPASESNSSYYTASWGSPYQHPATASIAGSLGSHRRSFTASSEADEDSPNPRFGLAHLLPSRLPPVFPISPTRPGTPSAENTLSSPTRYPYFVNPTRSIKPLFSSPRPGSEATQRAPAPSWSLSTANWRNSNQDGRTREVELLASAPQRKKSIKPFQLDGTTDTASSTYRSREKGHRSREDNLTLTQEDFWPTFTRRGDSTPSAMYTSRHAVPPPPRKDTEPAQHAAISPNPRLPTPSTMERNSPHLSVQRTDSTISVPSRIRKKVPYKGKNVQICIPYDDRRGTPNGPPMPLSPEAVKARLEHFESAGYDTRGFGNWNYADPFLEQQDRAQNRGIWPDPVEEIEAQKEHRFNVSVPDRRQWQAYVDFLREEKLRALGVSLGESDGGTAMSRQSSFSASQPFSPPLPTSSAGSHRHGHHQSVFTTGFIPGSSNHTSTRSIASPISSMGNSRHMHRQSMFTSPPNFAQQAMSPNSFAAWSPHQVLSPTGMPSGGSPNLPDFNNRRSPVSPFVQSQGQQSYPFPQQRDDLLVQMQRQKQQQVQMQQQQLQQLLSTRPPSILQEVPEAEDEEELPAPQRILPMNPAPEIVNPKPSHRHNISLKLEEDIQKSDYHLEESMARQLDEDDTFTPDTSAEWDESEAKAVHSQALELPPRTTSLQTTNGAVKAPETTQPGANVQKALSVVSDVDTNPSETERLANAPKPAESNTTVNANPWADDPTFKPRSPSPEKERPAMSNHSSKSSTSKLNIAAKPFTPSGNPSATFNPAIFGQSTFSFQPAKAKATMPTSTGGFGPLDRASRHSSKTSASGLSAAAPAFSPSAAVFGSPSFAAPTFGAFSPPVSDFNFMTSGPSFRPTAPTFQPQTVTALSENSVKSASEAPNKIFSNINLTDIMPPAKKSKALPVLPPSASAARDAKEEVYDAEGRLGRADDRMKRARRGGDDGDEVPRFASPTPELTSKSIIETGLPEPAIAENKKKEVANKEPAEAATEVELHGSVSAPVRVEAHPPSVVDKIEETEQVSELVDESDLPAQDAMDSTFGDATSGVEPGASTLSPVSSMHEESHAWEKEREEPEAHAISNTSTLSAAAPAFEFKPTFTIDPALKSLVATRLSNTTKDNHPLALASPRSTSNGSRTDIDHSDDHAGRSERASGGSPSRERLPSSVRYFDDLDQPSFQEIDAIMQHFNEEGSDAGIEREDPSWPNTSHDESVSPRTQTPEVPDFAPPKLRSDAPSPSPRRSLFARPLHLPEPDSASITQDPFSDARAVPTYDSPIHHLNENGDAPISDWDDVVSSAEDDRLRERTTFFDSRVSEVIGAAVDFRLAPLEKRLQEMMQTQLAQFQAPVQGRRVRSQTTLESDADDEDDDLETDTYSRGWSPKRDRRMEKFKTILQDALSSQQRNHSPTPMGLSEISALHAALEEVKASVSKSMNAQPNLDLFKAIVDESVSKQNEKLILAREEAITREAADRFSDLAEKSNKIAAQLSHEIETRKMAEEREQNSQRQLALAEEELVLLKQSLHDANGRVAAFEAAARDAQKEAAEVEDTRAGLSKKLMAVASEKDALKQTLEEYRISSDKWRRNIEQADAEKEQIRVSFGALKIQAEEALRIRETMRSRIEKLQDGVSAAAGQAANERYKWARADSEHRTRYEILSARIEAEGRTRERLERELERLETQEMEAMRLRVTLEQSQKEVSRLVSECERLDMQGREIPSLKFELVQMQKENSRLEDLVDNLRSESSEHRKLADKYASEFREARDAGRLEVQRTRGLMEVDIEAANNQVNIIRADLESEIGRVRAELENVKMDADTAKAKHELELEQEADARRDAVRESAEARQSALLELREAFEERLEELRKQHQRELEHSIEIRNQSESMFREAHQDRQGEIEQRHERALEQVLAAKEHTEAMLNERLVFADSKIDLLQDKVLHLEEKLEVAKAAANAAVMAAQSAKSPVPQTSASASRVHDRVATQALRESIGVLQDQLQEREARIEALEHELSKVDKDAPNKLQERDTEIGWLRELLGVRLDDLSDLVNALALPTYDRGAVRNAAIRIRASIQMEQQEKERQLSGAPEQSLPTLASISNFASPKAAQLAAAIGNWRKGGTMAPSGLSQSLSNLTGSTTSNSSSQTQTPSKPSSAAQNFLNGLMTPPASNVRKSPSPGASTSSGPDMGRPLSSLRHDNRERPLRNPDKMPISHAEDESPSTSPLLGTASYDEDAEESASGYYDDDESTMEGTPRADKLSTIEPLSLRDD